MKDVNIKQNKILIIHQGAIGDLILSLPSFYSIRVSFPKHHFKVMGYPEILNLIHRRFYADSISSVERAFVASLYNETGNISNEIKKFLSQFKTIFVFGGESQEIFIKNIKKNIQGSQVFRIPVFPDNNTEHVTDFQLRKTADLGFDVKTKIPKLFPAEDDINKGIKFLKEKGVCKDGDPLIALHLGSGGLKKRWPHDNYIRFISGLYRNIKSVFLMIEGPADDGLKEKLKYIPSSVPVIYLKNADLPFLAAIISQCALYAGNDSGITHIAAALGVATIALFGPTDPMIWGPRGDKVYIIRKNHGERSWEWPDTDEVISKAMEIMSNL
jgi:ADP-heptose:LPS heptosyltransferase